MSLFNIPLISMTETAYLIGLGALTLIATLIIVFLTIRIIKHPYPNLANYVKHAKGNGHDHSTIRKTLTNSGWPENIVNYELDKHFKKQ